MLRLGIDVGGTNTDAVAMDGPRVLGKVKVTVTPDVTTGITQALRSLLAQTAVHPAQISAVMIGTTHFTNAFVERKNLMPTAVCRIGLPATTALPPMADWPADLRASLGHHVYLLHGGHEFDGRLIHPLEPDEIRAVAAQIRARDLRTVALSSVFSPVNSSHEEEAAAIMRAELPGVDVSLSHEIGRIGLLERENAAIINACLKDLARKIVGSFREAMAALGILAPLYLTQNDGTLMKAEYAERYPVLTFASGPTNSMRGACFLSGLKDGIVVDVGGTTTDVGALVKGFPRQASVVVEVGGVRTNFRMPDVYSLGLGGGSLVTQNPLRIGPQSVGYELTQRALVFGGSTLTATDVGVAAGLAEIGDAGKVAHLDRALVQAALDRMQALFDASIDRMKTSADPVPVVLVGGGSILVARPIAGGSEILQPPHFEAANAIGAAIAQVSGEVDRVFSLERITRDQALAEASQEAIAQAIAAGARAETIAIVDVEDIPLTYLPGNATRIHVKAVGDLDTSAADAGDK